MSDEQRVRFCAPTLANIKTANLFSSDADSWKQLKEQVCRANRRLLPKGIRILLFRGGSGRARIYMYRPSRLAEDLNHELAAQILDMKGYPAASPEKRLAELGRRLKASGRFPHEIGLFLGYLPVDVEGFIQHHARCYKAAGYWKVYSDETAAQKQFLAYSRCTECYCRRQFFLNSHPPGVRYRQNELAARQEFLLSSYICAAR